MHMGDLMPPGRTDGKLEFTNLLSSGVDEEYKVFKSGGNSTQNAHDELEVDRFLGDAFLEQESQVVDHAGIVNLEFRLRAIAVNDLQILAHGLEGVGEDEVLRPFEDCGFSPSRISIPKPDPQCETGRNSSDPALREVNSGFRFEATRTGFQPVRRVYPRL